MYKVLEIRINGFRNIFDTTIRLTNPITVLLAPNNYGKTNVLQAIEFAATLVSEGFEQQEIMLKDNGYTSYNEFDEIEDELKMSCVSFGILYDFKEVKIDYSFRISPKFGVLNEKMTVGSKDVFTRKRDKEDINGDDLIDMEDSIAYISPFNLFASVFNDRDSMVTEYVDMTRKLFINMNNMFCNRESPYGSYSTKKNRDPSAIVDSILRLFQEDSDQYFKFRRAFLGLFKGEINSFEIYSVINRTKEVLPKLQYGFNKEEYKIDFSSSVYRAVDYRLEFDSSGRARLELFNDLSAGTQDIFLALLELFAKKGNPLVAIEELENGIHPSLYRRVLGTIDAECIDKRVLVTTHSPSVARHFSTKSFSSFYVGIPNSNRFATFAALDEYNQKKIEAKAALHGVSIGELIIDMLSESEDSIDELKGWLRV